MNSFIDIISPHLKLSHYESSSLMDQADDDDSLLLSTIKSKYFHNKLIITHKSTMKHLNRIHHLKSPFLTFLKQQCHVNLNRSKYHITVMNDNDNDDDGLIGECMIHTKHPNNSRQMFNLKDSILKLLPVNCLQLDQSIYEKFKQSHLLKIKLIMDHHTKGYLINLTRLRLNVGESSNRFKVHHKSHRNEGYYMDNDYVEVGYIRGLYHLNLPRLIEINDEIDLFQFEQCKLSDYSLKDGCITFDKLESVKSYNVNDDFIFPCWNNNSDILINFQKSIISSIKCQDNDSTYYNTDSFHTYLIDMDKVTESSKYKVHSQVNFNKDIKLYTTSDIFHNVYFKYQFIRYFKVWNLSPYQLIHKLEWMPFTSDVNEIKLFKLCGEDVFEDREVNCRIDHDGLIIFKRVMTDEFLLGDYGKIPPCDDVKPINIYQEITLSDPEKSLTIVDTSTEISTNVLTNVATFNDNDDDDEFENLIKIKRQKLSNTNNSNTPFEFPQYLSFYSFMKEPNVSQSTEISNSKLNSSQFKFDMPLPIINSHHYILINSTMLKKHYPIFKQLQLKINILEVKLIDEVDFVINSSTGIIILDYIQIIQRDLNGQFLIIDTLLKSCRNYNQLYVLIVMNSSIFNNSEPLTNFQLMCHYHPSLKSIRILIINRENIFPWMMNIMKKEPPQDLSHLNQNKFDLNHESVTFLIECGLNYFQTLIILNRYSLFDFIQLSIDEKITLFDKFIPKPSLVSFTRSFSIDHCLHLIN
ncbi:hypothetical protein DFJ63DRAFT_310596 [Scheffersomyces coipomensis]|uniref:uncharacterized protein n=1 Tax=Scheffersomyces coipomensis TaxID=1788519 RepID=UPI00315CADB0